MSNTFNVKESLVDTMEKDSQLDNLKDSKVTDVSTLCQKQVDLEAEINRDKRKLEEKEESLRKLSLEINPNALAEMNLKSLKLADGSEVSIKDFYHARITEKNKSLAYKWLRDNGYGDLIKNEIAVPFGRGEDERANDLLKTLVNNGYEPNQKTVVHPQTLKAFVKEQLESGKELPLDLLGAYAGQKTVIKKGGK